MKNSLGGGGGDGFFFVLPCCKNESCIKKNLSILGGFVKERGTHYESKRRKEKEEGST